MLQHNALCAVVTYKSQSAEFGKSDKLLPSFKCSFLSIWRKRYLLETLSQLFLIKMKLAVLTVTLLLCAVLATTVTAAPSDERGKNFSCFYMLLYPCSFLLPLMASCIYSSGSTVFLLSQHPSIIYMLWTRLLLSSDPA